MFSLSQSEHLPIGVDLGHDSIKLVQLRKSGTTLRVHAAAQVPNNTGKNLINALDDILSQMKEVIGQSGFRGRNIVLSLPGEFLQIKTLRLPMLADNELQSAIELEARNLFVTPSEELTIRFLPAGEVRMGNESKLEVIVIAAETKLVESLLEQMNRARMYVNSLDFEPCSIYRTIERFTRRKEDENEVNVLVDIGAHSSQIVIGRGKEIGFTKSIDIAGNTFNECVARKLALSMEDAASLRRSYSDLPLEEHDSVRQAVVDATRDSMTTLAHEISLCLRYYSVTFRGQRPSRVRLLGGQTYDKSLRAALAGSLTVPVEIYSPFQGIELGNSLLAAAGSSLSEWGTALGSAIRRVKGDIVRRAEPASQSAGRRKSDESMVEVVDLSREIKTAGVMETPDNKLTVTSSGNSIPIEQSATGTMQGGKYA